MRIPLALLLVLLLGAAPWAGAWLPDDVPAVAAAVAGELPDELVPGSWLVLGPVDRRGRRPFRPDTVFERHLLDPDAAPPEAGQALTGETGDEQAWERREADENGSPGTGAAWAYTALESPADGVLLADVRGASVFFVNGDGFAGDVYRFGFGGIPVALKRGTNHVYVNGIRGAFSCRLTRPDGPLVVMERDITKPDVVAGSHELGPLGIPIWNATTEPIEVIGHAVEGDELTTGWTASELIVIPPLAVYDLTIKAVKLRPLPTAVDGTLTRQVRLLGEHEVAIDVALRQVGASEAQRRTFISGIDGSVQFYAVLPPSPSDSAAIKTVLSLHGAGVDALAQVRSYAAKPDFWIVAPTNRRPFGFDWQDWGRADAYEALERFLERQPRNSRQVYLTGHSMGGHGVWHLAANDADRFAAIAPSAGWESFDTYGGRPEGALSALWHGADGPSLTSGLLENLVSVPTFVLHGSADDNVPARQAEDMLAALQAAGAEPRSHFEEGAGHWWDVDPAGGADCVDWPGIFELFRESEPRTWDGNGAFVSMDPGVDSRHHDIVVRQVLRYGEPFRVEQRWDGDAHRLELTTRNVRHLELRIPGRFGEQHEVVLDGQRVDALHATLRQLFVREDGRWRRADRPRPWQKTPERSGPFKRAFDNRFVLVVGTAGSEQENAELLARARYDAEVWWYRGNGRTELLTDEQFLSAPSLGGRGAGSNERYADRNVILYGNVDTNVAWDAVLSADCPLRVRRGGLRLGSRTWEGDDLAATFVYPRWESDTALVGVFADTGVKGTRLGYTLAPFVSGVGYPDYAVFDRSILGAGDGGVQAAGWFDHAWRLPDEER